MVTDIVHKTSRQGELSGHPKMQRMCDHSTWMKTLSMLTKQSRIKYSDHRGGEYCSSEGQQEHSGTDLG